MLFLFCKNLISRTSIRSLSVSSFLIQTKNLRKKISIDNAIKIAPKSMQSYLLISRINKPIGFIFIVTLFK